MKVAIYSAYKFEKDYLAKANNGKHELLFIGVQLSLTTTIIAEGCEAVSIFVKDDASKSVLENG